ncbi:MAG: hypothetical protein HKL90_04305 [Elusimicrobia bacterium]|nr:hypothetical protein [Elusimicrobiota bacterium]
MRRVLESFLIVAALALGLLVLRAWRGRSAARVVAAPMASDAPVPGTPPPAAAVQGLAPIKLRLPPRSRREAAPPPPPAPAAN